MKAGRKLYQPITVLDAATQRIATLFDAFEHIVLSISGGKDSTVLFDLCIQEAAQRGRPLDVFFLDQEAEYQATIDQVAYLMSRPGVIPHWYQVPIRMTNAASLQVDFLNAWEPGEPWMRTKHPLAIHQIDEPYPHRFYRFFTWWERQWDPATTVFLVALRAEESLNRFRTVIKHPGWGGHLWTSSSQGVVKAYPLYDWTYEDVWHHLAIRQLRYNAVYDYMYRHGYQIQDVRVSYLGHENSFRCLTELHAFEPETYAKLLARMPGIHVAARYAKSDTVFTARRLPAAFASWRAYRDFLLETTPSAHADRFRSRFSSQGDAEAVCRQQCRQLLINDWEQNVPVTQPKSSKEDQLAKWKAIL